MIVNQLSQLYELKLVPPDQTIYITDIQIVDTQCMKQLKHFNNIQFKNTVFYLQPEDVFSCLNYIMTNLLFDNCVFDLFDAENQYMQQLINKQKQLLMTKSEEKDLTDSISELQKSITFGDDVKLEQKQNVNINSMVIYKLELNNTLIHIPHAIINKLIVNYQYFVLNYRPVIDFLVYLMTDVIYNRYRELYITGDLCDSKFSYTDNDKQNTKDIQVVDYELKINFSSPLQYSGTEIETIHNNYPLIKKAHETICEINTMYQNYYNEIDYLETKYQVINDIGSYNDYYPLSSTADVIYSSKENAKSSIDPDVDLQQQPLYLSEKLQPLKEENKHYYEYDQEIATILQEQKYLQKYLHFVIRDEIYKYQANQFTGNNQKERIVDTTIHYPDNTLNTGNYSLYSNEYVTEHKPANVPLIEYLQAAQIQMKESSIISELNYDEKELEQLLERSHQQSLQISRHLNYTTTQHYQINALSEQQPQNNEQNDSRVQYYQEIIEETPSKSLQPQMEAQIIEQLPDKPLTKQFRQVQQELEQLKAEQAENELKLRQYRENNKSKAVQCEFNNYSLNTKNNDEYITNTLQELFIGNDAAIYEIMNKYLPPYNLTVSQSDVKHQQNLKAIKSLNALNSKQYFNNTVQNSRYSVYGIQKRRFVTELEKFLLEVD